MLEKWGYVWSLLEKREQVVGGFAARTEVCQVTLVQNLDPSATFSACFYWERGRRNATQSDMKSHAGESVRTHELGLLTGSPGQSLSNGMPVSQKAESSVLGLQTEVQFQSSFQSFRKPASCSTLFTQTAKSAALSAQVDFPVLRMVTTLPDDCFCSLWSLVGALSANLWTFLTLVFLSRLIKPLRACKWIHIICKNWILNKPSNAFRFKWKLHKSISAINLAITSSQYEFCWKSYFRADVEFNGKDWLVYQHQSKCRLPWQLSTVRQVQRSQDKEKAKLWFSSNISSVEVLQKYPLLH